MPEETASDALWKYRGVRRSRRKKQRTVECLSILPHRFPMFNFSSLDLEPHWNSPLFKQPCFSCFSLHFFGFFLMCASRRPSTQLFEAGGFRAAPGCLGPVDSRAEASSRSPPPPEASVGPSPTRVLPEWDEVDSQQITKKKTQVWCLYIYIYYILYIYI